MPLTTPQVWERPSWIPSRNLILLAGLWYLNIHTAANPGGEIRGQVVDQPDRWLFDFPITSDQSVHEIELGEAAPSGTGLVTYDTRTGSVDWFITYEGLTGPPTAMHFHGLAAPGQAAGVDLGIGEFGEDSSTGSALLTAEQAADLRAGLWYLNIHTAANPAGEIRRASGSHSGNLFLRFSHKYYPGCQ